MKYQGSKARIVNEILPIMLNAMRPDQAFVDGFTGGGSVIQNVPPEYRRIANDNNRYLIAMWEKLTTTNWQPPTRIEKSFYDKVRDSWHKNDGKYEDALIGWVGFQASRNGRFYDGGYSGHNAKGRDYINENIKNTNKQLPFLMGVEWQCGSYECISMPKASLVYYDPPYREICPFAMDVSPCHIMLVQVHTNAVFPVGEIL